MLLHVVSLEIRIPNEFAAKCLEVVTTRKLMYSVL